MDRWHLIQGINPDNPPVIPEIKESFGLIFTSQFIFGEQEEKSLKKRLIMHLPNWDVIQMKNLIESDPKT